MIINKTLLRCAIISSLTISMNAAHAFPAWEVNMVADVNYARVKGMAQTPRGGSPNTTDSSRPLLSEAGIDDELYFDVGAGFSIYHFFLNFVYHRLQPEGSDTLKKALLTHNQQIAAGQEFSLRSDYDWYQLQMGNYFRFFRPGYEISPIVEGHWIHYHYAFSSYPVASARSFSMAATNLGLGFRFPVSEMIFGELQATTTLPFSNLSLNRINLVFHSNVLLTSHVALRPQLSLSIFRIDYEDFQLITNHIQYTATPNIALGCTLAFF